MQNRHGRDEIPFSRQFRANAPKLHGGIIAGIGVGHDDKHMTLPVRGIVALRNDASVATAGDD